jgi:uncharacterized repeat protein (TIGR01451 family)
MKTRRWNIRLLITALLLVIGCAGATFGLTPANTSIYNKAVATYEYNSQTYTVESNQVVTTVLPVYGITITPDGTTAAPGQQQLAAPGTTVYFPYLLTNTGNAADTYDLSTVVGGTSTFTPQNIRICLDINGNGQVDTGESCAATLNTGLVGQNKTIHLIVSYTVPVSAIAGQFALVDIQGVSTHDNTKTDINNYGRADCVSDAVLTITKSASPFSATPGSPITYTVSGKNTGIQPTISRAFANIDTNGDGAFDPASGILVKDDIPQYTHITGTPATDFVASAVPAGSIPLYGYMVGGTWQWSTNGNIAGWGGTTAITSVGLYIPGRLVPGQEYRFQWNAIVDTPAPAPYIQNQAKIDWQNGAGIQDDAPSNWVYSPLNPIPGVKIGPRSDPDGTGTGNYLTPDPLSGPFTITYAADLSDAAFATCGATHLQTIVFTNTIRNDGTSVDTFNITFNWTGAIAGSTVRLFRADGITALTDTNGDGIYDTGTVNPGSSLDLVVKVYIPQNTTCDALNHDIILTARSTTNPSIFDTTTDRIRFGPNIWDPIHKEVDPSGDVPPGITLRFTNTFGNKGGVAAVNVVIEDVLDVRLLNPFDITCLRGGTIPDITGVNPPIACTAIYTPGVPAGSGGTITWNFPAVPAGFEGQVSFRAQVDPAAPEDYTINNIVSITAPGFPTATSNVTVNTVRHESLLVVEKTANKTVVEVGDYLKYTITVKNKSSTAPVPAPINVVDNLPRGFRYIPGSARLDGNPFSDPVITNGGRTLTWNDIGSIAARGSKTLTFVVIVGADAYSGDGINRVQAIGRASPVNPMYSNWATAKVRFDKSLFRDCQTIIGKVFIDENDNRIQDESEIGLPGVRLYLEDGTFTITDSEGKYHFECVKFGTHVLKADKSSLPEGVEMASTWSRFMGDSDSQFIDLKSGGLFKANFRVIPKGIEKEIFDIVIIPRQATSSDLKASKVIKTIVFFKTDSADLLPLAIQTIDKALEELKDVRLDEVEVSIAGNADIRKTKTWKGGNQELSEARAKAFSAYIQKKFNIKPEKIKTKGYGTTRPLVETKELTDEALQPNRYAEATTVLPLINVAYAEAPEQKARAATVKINKSIEGPMTDTYLVVPSTVKIKEDSIKINGKVVEKPFEFDGFRWIRIKDYDEVFDAKAFDIDRQRVKLEEFAQAPVIEVTYTILEGEAPLHIIVGRDKRGEVRSIEECHGEQCRTKGAVNAEAVKSIYEKLVPNSPLPPLNLRGGAEGGGVPEKSFGILSPRDKEAFIARDKITIKVKFPSTEEPGVLKINGAEVSEKQIGKKVIDNKNKVAAFDYIAVPLKPGENTIEFLRKGCGCKADHIKVFLAKTPVKAEIRTLPHQLPADGKTEPELILKPVDENGLPMPDGLFITLEMDKGRFLTPDANPSQEGYQALIKDGVAKVKISAAHQAEERKIRVIAGSLDEKKTIEFLPYLRDWIVVGIGQGTLCYNDIKKNISGDKTDDDDGLFADGRLAFFLKGTVLGKYLLTAAYDSEKAREKSRLFQQVDPEKYYPVYGDSSIERYDAESSKKLYVKIERDKDYIMYGDYKTEFTDTETARYDRTLTGAKANIERKYFDVKAFWSKTDQTIVKDEIRGNGTSGYYYLTHRDIVENSDKVKIETRDRHNPATVLSSKDMSRYTDYWIDYDRGNILFKEPVRSVDDEFNPVYIVVVYETREGAEENNIYGGRAKLKLFDDKIEVGSTGVLEKNRVHDNKLYGADIKWKLNKHIEAKAEIAESDVYDKNDLSTKKGTSKAASIKADYGKNLKAEARYLETDKDFRNPSMSSFSGAIKEYTLKGESEYFKGTNLKLDASKKKNLLTDERLQTVGVEGKHKLTDKVTGILGGRYADIHTSSIDQKAALAKVGLTVDLTEKLKASLIREQVISGDRLDSKGFASIGSPFDTFTSTGANAPAGSTGYLGTGSNIIGDGFPDRTLVVLEYQLTEFTKLRAGHEWLVGKDIELHRTLFGATSQLSKNISVFGNYRIENSVDNPRDVANIGINNKIDVTDRLSMNLGLERLETVKGAGNDDFTAITTSFSYLPDSYKITGRYELRFGKKETRHLVELGSSRKAGADYTLFARERLFYTSNDDTSDTYLNELLIGLAYRPIQHDKFNLLSKLKLVNEKAASGDKNMKLIGSFEGNYQYSQPLTLSVKYAFKWQKDSFDDKSYRSFTDLIAARAMYDITKRWDCGVHGGMLHQYDSKTYDYYAGVETGYQIVKNLWVSVGYNFKGLKDKKDKDFRDSSYRTDGPYITLRFKFDEDTFTRGAKSEDKAKGSK